MQAKTKKTIINELKDFPEDRADFLLKFIHLLKIEDSGKTVKKTPNKLSEKTFKDTDNGKNLKSHSSLDSFFKKMES